MNLHINEKRRLKIARDSNSTRLIWKNPENLEYRYYGLAFISFYLVSSTWALVATTAKLGNFNLPFLLFCLALVILSDTYFILWAVALIFGAGYSRILLKKNTLIYRADRIALSEDMTIDISSADANSRIPFRSRPIICLREEIIDLRITEKENRKIILDLNDSSISITTYLSDNESIYLLKIINDWLQAN